MTLKKEIECSETVAFIKYVNKEIALVGTKSKIQIFNLETLEFEKGAPVYEEKITENEDYTLD